VLRANSPLVMVVTWQSK